MQKAPERGRADPAPVGHAQVVERARDPRRPRSGKCRRGSRRSPASPSGAPGYVPEPGHVHAPLDREAGPPRRAAPADQHEIGRPRPSHDPAGAIAWPVDRAPRAPRCECRGPRGAPRRPGSAAAAPSARPRRRRRAGACGVARGVGEVDPGAATLCRAARPARCVLPHSEPVKASRPASKGARRPHGARAPPGTRRREASRARPAPLALAPPARPARGRARRPRPRRRRRSREHPSVGAMQTIFMNASVTRSRRRHARGRRDRGLDLGRGPDPMASTPGLRHLEGGVEGCASAGGSSCAVAGSCPSWPRTAPAGGSRG